MVDIYYFGWGDIFIELYNLYILNLIYVLIKLRFGLIDIYGDWIVMEWNDWYLIEIIFDWEGNVKREKRWV